MVDFTTLVGESALDAWGHWVALGVEAVACVAASSDSQNVVASALDAWGHWAALAGQAADE